MSASPRTLIRRCLGLAVAVLVSVPGGAALAADPPLDYNRDIRPILSKNCFPCHGQDEGHRSKALRLDRREVAIAPLPDGVTAIVPGDPEASEVLFRVGEDDDTVRMPPKKTGNRLTHAEVDRLRRWIAQGAAYAEHWAFLPPRPGPTPEVADRAWPRNGIDPWVLARLEREGLAPSPEADRFALLRRASLDLRGLPPSPSEIDAFARDDRPDAYERAVDRLLADPAFGERWGRLWLDLARYADSAGYGSDPLRTIWRYRDWVIDAFNRNLPYDRFTVEQLAGDLLPNPSLEQRIATAFNRNTMTNTEGGTDDEEFRSAAIKDRVDTTMQVWMGLTVGCAKCHSHKYDPITHEEYYKLYDIFNQSSDNDQPDEGPTIPAPTPATIDANRRIDAEIAPLKAMLDAPTEELASAQADWERGLRPTSDWMTLGPASTQAESGASLSVRDDRSILVEGAAAPQDAYTITARVDRPGLTAFRLEAIPDPSLPAGGSGRAADGSFVLTRFAVESEPADSAQPAPVGRFVRIELPGPGKMLSLAEVQVLRGGENAARKGTASQSSTDFGGEPARAIDGNTDGRYYDALSTTHTRAEADPWWEVKLADDGPIDRIVVWNRTDGGTGARLAGFRVSVLDEARKVVWSSEVNEPPSPDRDLSTTGRQAVALARVQADFTQKGQDAMASLTGGDPKRGWAVAPKQAEPHVAIFLTKQPLTIAGPTRLTFRLEYRHPNAGSALGRFRLAATDDPAASKRIAVPAAILAIADTPTEGRTTEQSAALAAHFRTIAPALQPIRDRVAALEKSRPEMPTVPVMVELPADRRRTTHILRKGNFLDPGDKVEPGTPASLHPLPADSPRDRLGLARWLVDPTNPLTARVAVNRFWAQLFGNGLVETEEDFGTQGDLPSHPELLDWLAIEFVRTDWDVKAMLRTMVTSATYRQSSKVTPEAIARDPRNRLLGRATRFRLEAEMVRDQALALGGLLSGKVGGPSVFPVQPDGLWQAAFNGQRTWATSKGDDGHRRGLYTFWRRTVPYPSMATFDAPSREICAIRRVRTNTPLQAFVTLNDPCFVEAAQALARRIVREGGASVEDRVRFGLRLCLGRPAHEAEVGPLVTLFEAERERLGRDAESAKALATEPIGPIPDGTDAADLAAWAEVANVLLNLDGVLTRG